MAHFAQIDENNIVTRVLVIEQDMVDTGLWGDPSTFIQTSFNTRKGKHITGGDPLRKNYAGIGYYYDSVRDAFIYPKPEDWEDDEYYYTYNFDEDSCSWIQNVNKK